MLFTILQIHIRILILQKQSNILSAQGFRLERIWGSGDCIERFWSCFLEKVRTFGWLKKFGIKLLHDSVQFDCFFGLLTSSILGQNSLLLKAYQFFIWCSIVIYIFKIIIHLSERQFGWVVTGAGCGAVSEAGGSEFKTRCWKFVWGIWNKRELCKSSLFSSFCRWNNVRNAI